MAKIAYEPRNGGLELQAWDDPQILVRTDLEDNLASFQLFRGLTDEARSLLAQGGIPGAGIAGGWPDLASFDSYLDDEIERFLDLIDYFDYDSRQDTRTVRDGAWYVPEALESMSDENVGEEGTLSIDGDNGTWWQSDANGTRSIVFRVRSYDKKFEGIRLRISNENEDRAELQGVTVRAASNLAQIDNAENVVEADIDFVYSGGAWMEHTFADAAFRKKYLKIEVASSLHSNPDHVRIRELQVRVGVLNHDK